MVNGRRGIIDMDLDKEWLCAWVCVYGRGGKWIL